MSVGLSIYRVILSFCELAVASSIRRGLSLLTPFTEADPMVWEQRPVREQVTRFLSRKVSC